MREYEFTYIIQPDAADERIEEIHQKIAGTIAGGQGRILLRDDWGKRRLTYEIQKFQKGDYFVLEILGDGKFIPELERVLRIDPDVLRFLAVCVDRDVRDVEARVERAQREAAERARRRAERERQEAERLEQDRIAAREAALAASGAGEAEDDDASFGSLDGDEESAYASDDEEDSETPEDGEETSPASDGLPEGSGDRERPELSAEKSEG